MARTSLVLLLSLMVLSTSILPIEAYQTTQPRPTNAALLTLIDDGWGDPYDRNVEVPAYTPGFGETPTITLRFSIQDYGNAVYYGDGPGEDWKNITITGDILDPLNGLNIHHLTHGDWRAEITPIKTYGTYTLSITWAGHGNASMDFTTVNGSSTASSPSTFLYGKDANVTATVTDMDGEPVKFAAVFAYRPQDHVEFAATVGDNTVGNGKNGQYRFSLNTTNQGDRPQDIVIAASWWNDQFWSYTKIQPTIAQPSLMFIKGRLTNLGITNGNLTFKAVNIVTRAIPSWNLTRYTGHETIIVHTIIAGFITQRFILGICRVAIIT